MLLSYNCPNLQQNFQMCTKLTKRCTMTTEQVCQQVPTRVSENDNDSNYVARTVIGPSAEDKDGDPTPQV